MFTPQLLHLLHLCDPALPVGGFSHSGGLETYTQAGKVHDKETALLFAKQQLSQNIFYNDAALLSLAYDAVSKGDLQALVQLDKLCSAIKLPVELRTASLKLGSRLLKIFAHHLNTPLLLQYQQHIAARLSPGHYCIVFGCIAYAFHLPKAEALTGFYYNAAAGMVTNAVKLVPLGQQDGQQILNALFPLIAGLVEKSLEPDPEKIGFCCAGFDIRSMQHERLYSRLYMS